MLKLEIKVKFMWLARNSDSWKANQKDWKKNQVFGKRLNKNHYKIEWIRFLRNEFEKIGLNCQKIPLSCWRDTTKLLKTSKCNWSSHTDPKVVSSKSAVDIVWRKMKNHCQHIKSHDTNTVYRILLELMNLLRHGRFRKNARVAE